MLAIERASMCGIHDALNAWIFGETVLGEVLVTIGDHLTAAADGNPVAPLIRNFMIPEGHYPDENRAPTRVTVEVGRSIYT